MNYQKKWEEYKTLKTNMGGGTLRQGENIDIDNVLSASCGLTLADKFKKELKLEKELKEDIKKATHGILIEMQDDLYRDVFEDIALQELARRDRKHKINN